MAVDKKIAKNTYSLNKCNPRLSGNIKFVVDDKDIYIESIDSNAELKRTLYKAYKVNDKKSLMSNARTFFNLFDVKDDIFDVINDVNATVNNYSNQYNRMYNFGAYSDESELIKKAYRFFAPLHINKHSKKPDLFCVYAIDRKKYKNGNLDYVKDLVYTHDFRKSDMGKQLDVHIEDMKDFKNDIGVFVNFDDNISYTGTSIKTGIIETQYVDEFNSVLANERTVTEFNDMLTDGFRKSGLIDCRFLNLEFCFDIENEDSYYDDRFVDLIGFYVNVEDYSGIDEYNNSDSFFRLLENNDEFINKNIINIDDLTDNFKNVNTVNILNGLNDRLDGDFPPMIMFDMVYFPSIGDKIEFTYKNNVEISYTITKDDISTDKKETLENIARNFTKKSRNNVSNIFLDSFVYDGKLIIKSLINDETYNGISATKFPKNFKIIKTSSTNYKNNFYCPLENSIITKYPIGLDKNMGDSIGYNGNTSKILNYGQWLSYYYYNLDKPLNFNNGNDIVDVVRTNKSLMLGLRLIEHRTFDFDREITYHGDLFDFDLKVYKEWMIKEVNKKTFLGKYTNNVIKPTQGELDTYKKLILESIDRYFDSINLDRPLLLKELNVNDFTGKSIDNEYNRLSENDNINLIKKNIINQSISKFMYSSGLDAYNRPYMLNLNLPFRYLNFAPSMDSNNRNIRDATHNWWVIGEGYPPYFSEFNIDGKKAIINQVLETEQPTNIIERIFEDEMISSLNNWGVVDANLSIKNNTLVLSPTSHNNGITYILSKELNDIITSTYIKFNYNITIINQLNSYCNVSLSLINNVTKQVYKSWLERINLVSGLEYDINNNKSVKLTSSADNLALVISIPLGFKSNLTLKDINFYNSKININTFDKSIISDKDDIYGIERHYEDVISGYTTKKINKDDILSSKNDVYNFINSHSIVYEEDDSCYVFFRGVKIKMNNKYKGWKFSSILKTSSAPIKSDRNIELIENNTFKSITLLTTMYIPEPILTSLEIPNEYWLDRSLLYFSSGNYSTETSLSSFGFGDISLKIHDNKSPKKLNNIFVTNNWYHQIGGENYIHVNKGILSRFDVDFTSFLNYRGDLQCYFGDVSTTSTDNYGMTITFKNIKDISNNYFWCEEINVIIKETDNLGVTTVLDYDVLDTYLNNNNAFTDENKMDIVEAIILENAYYDRVLKNSGTIERFTHLSMESITDWVNNNSLTTTNEDGIIRKERISIIKPSMLTSVISLDERDNEIVQLEQPYTTPYKRQNGHYNPITKQLRRKGYVFNTNYSDYCYGNKVTTNDITNKVYTNFDKENNKVWFFRKDMSNTDLSKHYRYYENPKDFININWFNSPNEFKHEVSRVLISKKTIILKHKIVSDKNDNIDLFPLVKDYILIILLNNGYDESIYDDNVKLKMMKTFDNEIELDTLSNYKLTDIILKRFYENCFSHIYTIKKIIDNKGRQIDFLEIDNINIRLNTNIDINENIDLYLDRL